MSIQSEGPWAGYMRELYTSRLPPQPLGTVSPAKIEELAKDKLKEYPGAFVYAAGNAGTGRTYYNNLKAFETFAIKPRMLVDGSRRNVQTTIFGKKYPSPILLGPIGVQGMLHADGEEASARAAAAQGIPYIMSTAASRSIEDIAKANGDGERWYQLYWPLHDEVTLSLLKRANESKFSTLVVTTDTMLLGWRPQDLDTSYLPFAHSVGTQVGRSDPVFMKLFQQYALSKIPGLPEQMFAPIHEKPAFPYESQKIDKAFIDGDSSVKFQVLFGQAWLGEANSGKFRTWDDLKFLKDNWKGKILLKGIQNVEDAEKAVEAGVDGIIVSNHGGRQVDGAIPSLYALESISSSSVIREAKTTGFTVLFDSGIRTGSDIIKAVAHGADAVLLGRPYIYGLTVGGQAGVEQVIKHTLAELDNALGLAGHQDLFRDVHGKAEHILQKLDF